ncbi:VOC family protein [Paenibacillus sinopodophylli]|uniref:VOC family protein n=1 Tax=Paenibacillus sinopodophylli TaxID=1837342 RepID=UPI00110CE782|nr:VOC family protein [Paenibacillus sinopodophylli]
MRIHSIKLLTKQLKQLHRFYTDVFGLTLKENSSETFAVKVGHSDLIFELADHAEENPFYHFAFDIPENKIDEAIVWLDSVGVTLNILPDNTFKAYSKTWHATSIYFYDPAGNIVEFIARHNHDNAILAPFTGKELLRISEIGLVVNDVTSMKDSMRTNYIINGYKDSYETFAAIGDEEGLFILSANHRAWLGSDKKASIFKTEITIEGTPEGVFVLGQYPYSLSVIGTPLT